METANLLTKIRALLAKAEATDNEHEADAYFAKAQEWIERHAVEEWQLAPADRERVTSKVVALSKMTPDAYLLNSACLAGNVKMLRKRSGSAVTGLLYGYVTDISFVEGLYASLLLQRERALNHAKVSDQRWDESGRSFNHSFRLAYAMRVAARIQERKQATNNEPGTALVLRDRVTEAENALKADHPKTGKVRTSATSHAGLRAGHRAGANADISGGRGYVGGHRTAVSS